MNFDDLRLIDKKKIVFMPSNLRCKFSEILAEKRPDIEQESIGRMSITPGSKVYLQRADFYEKHKDLFSDSIYEKEYTRLSSENGRISLVANLHKEKVFKQLKESLPIVARDVQYIYDLIKTNGEARRNVLEAELKNDMEK